MWVPRSPLSSRTAPGLQLNLSGASLQGLFKICSQTKVGRPSSGSVSSHVFHRTPGWAGLLLDYCWEGLEHSYRATSKSAVGPKPAGLPPGAWTRAFWKAPGQSRTAPGPELRGTGAVSSSAGLSPEAQVGMTPPGSLGRWCW